VPALEFHNARLRLPGACSDWGALGVGFPLSPAPSSGLDCVPPRAHPSFEYLVSASARNLYVCLEKNRSASTVTITCTFAPTCSWEVFCQMVRACGAFFLSARREERLESALSTSFGPYLARRHRVTDLFYSLRRLNRRVASRDIRARQGVQRRSRDASLNQQRYSVSFPGDVFHFAGNIPIETRHTIPVPRRNSSMTRARPLMNGHLQAQQRGICTYKRPVLLGNLLGQLAEQETEALSLLSRDVDNDRRDRPNRWRRVSLPRDDAGGLLHRAGTESRWPGTGRSLMQRAISSRSSTMMRSRSGNGW